MSDCPPGCLVNSNISYLREKYCQTGIIRVNRLANIRVCIAKYHCHLYFNHRFNEYNVFPSSLRFRSPVQSAKGYKFSPLIEAPDRTFDALVGSMNCNFSVTFIKSLNQSSITLCQIDMKNNFTELTTLRLEERENWIRLRALLIWVSPNQKHHNMQLE